MSGCSPCQAFVNGVPGGGSGFSVASIFRSAEIDFREQTAGALANGPRDWVTTDDIPIPSTIANVAAAGVWEIDASAGLHFQANASSTGFSTTVVDASHVYQLFGALYTALDVDASWDLTVRIYAPSISIPTNTAVSGAGLGLSVWGLAGQPNGSVARMYGIRRSHSSGVDTLLQIGAASSYNTSVAALDVFGIINAPGACDAIAGNWDGTEDTWAAARTPVELSAIDSSSNLTSGTRHATFNRIALSFGTGNAAGDMDITVERMRFDFARRTAPN